LSTRRFLLLLLVPVLAACGGKSRPSVLLVIVDTVPAGHVGYCGYDRNTTPVIDSLASSGAGFLQCQAQSPWTLPSCVSIVSGLTVRSHGVRRYTGGEVTGMGADLPTIEGVLHRSGYATAAFTNSYMLGPDFGWHRGFDRFNCEPLGHHNPGPTVDMCLAWMDSLDGRPFFALVHFFEPHDPYDPAPPYDTMFGPGGAPFDWTESDLAGHPDSSLCSHFESLYDGGLAEVDHQLGRLLEGVRRRGLGDNTIVIVVADHGEEFMEHGLAWHGKSLYQAVLRVPLVLAGPGVPRGEVSRPVGQVDIVPTLAALLGVDWPGRLDGQDLFAPSEESPPIYSSNLNAGPLEMACVRVGDMKTIWEATSNTSLSFDLAADPGETRPLPPDSAGLDLVQYYWATPRLYVPMQVDRQHVDQMLQGLGYL